MSSGLLAEHSSVATSCDLTADAVPIVGESLLHLHLQVCCSCALRSPLALPSRPHSAGAATTIAPFVRGPPDVSCRETTLAMESRLKEQTYFTTSVDESRRDSNGKAECCG